MTEVDQVAVSDPREERLDSLLRSLLTLLAFPDLDAALDHVDAVVISTPPSTHFDLTQKAAGFRSETDDDLQRQRTTADRACGGQVADSDGGAHVRVQAGGLEAA